MGGGHRVEGAGHKRRRQVGGGGASLVQCNGRGSCEKRSPLFPTTSPMRRPRFSQPRSSHISNTYTGPADSHNAYTQLIYFMYAHRQKHRLVHMGRGWEGADGLCDRRGLGPRFVAGSDFLTVGNVASSPPWTLRN